MNKLEVSNTKRYPVVFMLHDCQYYIGYHGANGVNIQNRRPKLGGGDQPSIDCHRLYDPRFPGPLNCENSKTILNRIYIISLRYIWYMSTPK